MGRRASRFLFPVILLFLASGTALSAQSSDELSGDFWTELEPFPGSSSPRELPAETLLEEARYVFSGMIYGYSFLYTPSDAVRKIPEVFQLTPLAEIPRGDPALLVKSTLVENGRLYVRCNYRMKDFQRSRRESYRSSMIAKSAGQGEVSLFDGPGARVSAVQSAVKNAIREHARGVEFNKPREIRGEVYLSEVPYVVSRNGVYAASVVVKLMVREIRPYSAF